MKESGYYPPGAEHDPNAPYNQTDGPDLEHISNVLMAIGDLEELIEYEDALNSCLKKVRELYDMVARIRDEVEDG